VKENNFQASQSMIWACDKCACVFLCCAISYFVFYVSRASLRNIVHCILCICVGKAIEEAIRIMNRLISCDIPGFAPSAISYSKILSLLYEHSKTCTNQYVHALPLDNVHVYFRLEPRASVFLRHLLEQASLQQQPPVAPPPGSARVTK
jgi:hypothetical protein